MDSGSTGARGADGLQSGGRPGACGRPVFCILDPSLRDFVGHHFAYDHAVAGAAETAGFEAVTLGHGRVIPEIARTMRVEPCFRRDIWDRHPFAQRVPGLPGRLLNQALGIQEFARDLRRGLHRLNLPPGSVLLGHMITAKHLPGLTWVLGRGLPRGGRDITAILLLRYQSFFYDNPVAARAFRRLERLVAAGRRIRLASDSARLAEQIGRLTSLPVEVLPIPHTPPPQIPAPQRDSGRIRFVSLGNARDEKGFLEILEAIERLRAEPGGLAGMEFVLQANDAAPDVAAAIEAFAAACPPEVTLLPQALDAQAYDEALAAADVVLLPYWRSIYEARTSGVFLEAVAAGKPVIASADTWMSDELARHGAAGVLVPDRDPAALASAIRQVARDHAVLAARAASARGAVLAQHSAAALVAQCAGEPPPPLPRRAPRRVAMFYPWPDLLERSTGASLRCNLLLDVIAPQVDSVEVLQSGHAPATRRGNVHIAAAPLRLRHDLMRRAFRLAALPFTGRAGFGEELFLWYHLERLLDPGFRRQVREIVRRADVVLLEYSFWGRIVLAACRTYRVPCVLTQHDVLAEQVRHSRVLQRLTLAAELSALRRADHAACVSSTDQAIFQRHGVKARMIANPVDLDRAGARLPGDPRTLLRILYGIVPPREALALFVGSRFPANLAAVARIRGIARTMPELGFIIAGACAEPGRQGNVLAVGRVPDAALAALYAIATLVVIPLESGSGSSLKTIEAMATGRPVLGTSVAFRGLDLRPGEDCLLEDDLVRWPDLIRHLLADSTRAAAIGMAGRRAAEHHDYRRIFADYSALLGLSPEAGRPVSSEEAQRRRERELTIELAQHALARDRTDIARDLLAMRPSTGAAACGEARSAVPVESPGWVKMLSDNAELGNLA